MRYADTTLVHPRMVPGLRRLLDILDERLPRFAVEFEGVASTGHFEVFETYRTPQRQRELEMPVAGQAAVTHAGPWESAHQYGLAVDFAVMVSSENPAHAGGWLWPADAPWLQLRYYAEEAGLTVPIKWDLGHVQHPVWPQVANLLRPSHSEASAARP